MSERKRIRFMGNFRSLTLVVASLIIVPACFAQAPPSAPAPSSNSEIAWFWMGRVAFNPANGNTLPYGYFTIINGINGSPFSLFNTLNPAAPESTAFFTFRYSVFQTLTLTANLDQIVYIGSPAIVDIYYDPNPKRDFNDPNSFSTGKKVATYVRGTYQGEQITLTQFQVASAKLVSSTPFPFNGQTIDFGKLAPGATIGDYVGIVPTLGFYPQFPLSFAMSSYALATNIGAPPVAKTTSAIAAPASLTATTAELRLDGTGSTSAAGAQLKYEWSTAPGSPDATILDGNTATPLVRLGATRGVYTFRLKVTDADGNSSSDFATIKYAGN